MSALSATERAELRDRVARARLEREADLQAPLLRRGASSWRKSANANSYGQLLSLETFEDRLLAAVGRKRLEMYGSLTPPEPGTRRKRKETEAA
jgi:hypothetical protein